eukprot:1162148-Pelagomonas_calceolata.AAC.1
MLQMAKQVLDMETRLEGRIYSSEEQAAANSAATQTIKKSLTVTLGACSLHLLQSAFLKRFDLSIFRVLQNTLAALDEKVAALDGRLYEQVSKVLEQVRVAQATNVLPLGLENNASVSQVLFTLTTWVWGPTEISQKRSELGILWHRLDRRMCEKEFCGTNRCSGMGFGGGPFLPHGRVCPHACFCSYSYLHEMLQNEMLCSLLLAARAAHLKDTGALHVEQHTSDNVEALRLELGSTVTMLRELVEATHRTSQAENAAANAGLQGEIEAEMATLQGLLEALEAGTKNQGLTTQAALEEVCMGMGCFRLWCKIHALLGDIAGFRGLRKWLNETGIEYSSGCRRDMHSWGL